MLLKFSEQYTVDSSNNLNSTSWSYFLSDKTHSVYVGVFKKQQLLEVELCSLHWKILSGTSIPHDLSSSPHWNLAITSSYSIPLLSFKVNIVKEFKANLASLGTSTHLWILSLFIVSISAKQHAVSSVW